MFIADSEANATTTNRLCISSGDILNFNVDNWAGHDAMINLRDVWFDGEAAGDKFVVMYMQDKDKMFGGLT
jgi:hypothetical protein